MDELEDPKKSLIPIGVQLLLFFLLWFMGTMVGQFFFEIGLRGSVTGDLAELDLNQPRFLIPAFALHQFFGLLIPVLYFKRITKQSVWDFVKIKGKLNGKWLLICLAALPIGLYAIELLAELNDSLRHLIQDNYFVQREEEMNKIHQVLFYHKNTGQFLATLIVSAALPAIVEEVIFRGILFGKLMVTSKNNLHFSAIISGLLFAAIHQQPLQILPIAFMGAGFAYLYHYTQNLKYTILLHFFVNAVQISSVFFLGGYQLF